MKRFVSSLIILLITFSCLNEPKMPNFEIRSFKNDIDIKKLSDIITGKAVVLWLPLKSCGICVKNTMKVLKETTINKNVIVITNNITPIYFNWIKLNITKMNKTNIEFFYIDKNEEIKYNAFINRHKETKSFIIDNNLVILRVIKLNGDDKFIEKVLKKLSS